MNNLTENLREWRKARNITNDNYLTFVGNVLEELLEPLYENKKVIEHIKQNILNDNFLVNGVCAVKTNNVIDAIQDIQVFCINETELMGYDNLKCNDEVFKHINCRKQDPIQKEQWEKFGAYGKWEKDKKQPKEEIYEPNYEVCKL